MDDESLDDLRDITDPAQRAVRATACIERFGILTEEASRIRREALGEMRDTRGMTQTAMAGILGVSRARIAQLMKDGPPPERVFWGTGKVTVALGGKLEAPKEASGGPGPVVAVEDFAAYNSLSESLHAMGLETGYEIVQPPGFLDLNRENLVVICGPRLSPMIGQVLASDLALGFVRDDAGWHLIDRQSRQVWRSPVDVGDSGDIGYLGRLPRPDSQGTFVYIAGIHASGAAGVVHYLDRDLAEVYREARLKRFSTLIRCEFDPITRAVTSSERITPLYVHGGS
jgi:transcriptional regulator with XRE-family HTH domain